MTSPRSTGLGEINMADTSLTNAVSSVEGHLGGLVPAAAGMAVPGRSPRVSPRKLKDSSLDKPLPSLPGEFAAPQIIPHCNGGGIFALDGSPGLTDGHSKDPKLQYVSPDDEEFEQLKEQMLTQLEEGQGETIYEIGVGAGCSSSGLSPDELGASLATLGSLATCCAADATVLRQRRSEEGRVAEVLVRRKVGEEDFLEVRVAVVGNVDAGKSTLLGVLTHGQLDNGRGVARQRLFRHKHEMESGRTSSVGNDILGFDDRGRVVNSTDGHSGLNWEEICRASTKVITFIDLAGHEKYLKTTIFGMTGHAPDFCMLMIGANAGIVGMTKEHLGLALALNVPVFVVMTKMDMCPPNVLQENMRLLNKILKSPGCRKIPVLVQSQDDVITSATNFTSERICPIFQISNVTGENLGILKTFMNLLSPRMHSNQDKPPEFQIDDTYSVPGVGTVVSGTCFQGVIQVNDVLLLGPSSLGEFLPVAIKGIHRKRMPVREVHGGQTASFALKKVRRNQIRKGMVMVHPSANPVACWEFEGDILVLHHPTTISPKYQAMVHCGSTRQTASILTMNKENLRTGDKATCHFRFIKNPEFLHEGARMVFREGRTKAIGSIVKLFPYVPGSSTKPGGGGVGGGGGGGSHGGKPNSLHKSHKAALYHHHRHTAHTHHISAAIGLNPPGRSGGSGKTRGRRSRGKSRAAFHHLLTTNSTSSAIGGPSLPSPPSSSSSASITAMPLAGAMSQPSSMETDAPPPPLPLQLPGPLLVPPPTTAPHQE